MKLLGHAFADPVLAELALTHRSMGRPNNERMEFLGDALVNLIVAELLFERRPRADEGELSRLRAHLVSGTALAAMARTVELGARLKLGPGELKSGGVRRDSILADAFEASVAAIFLDAGFDVVRECLRVLFEPALADVGGDLKDAKTRLQEWLQGHGMPLPEYRLENVNGEEHARTFDVVCVLQEPQPMHFEGSGSSRRHAEQVAAQRALDAVESRAA